jgi:hypothetical protein
VLRHEFRPGKLLAGLFLTLAGIIYAGDAGGAWETPWFAVIPILTVGLCLAGATGLASRAMRRRRAGVGAGASGAGGESEGAR